MTFATGPGAIVIGVTLADGHVCAVEIKSSRPTGLGRFFIERANEEVPFLVERIFTLCGFSHRVAATQAIAAAQGRQIPASYVFDLTVGLLAERIGESLRACLLGWPHHAATERRIAAAMTSLRLALACSQELMSAARSGICHEERHALHLVAEQLAAAVHALGVPHCGEYLPAARSFFAALMADVADEETLLLRAPDALQPEDDAAIATALQAGGSAFAALPSLSDRIVETGAFARHWQEVDKIENILAARLVARLFDIRQAQADLLKILASGDGQGCDLFGAARLEANDACAAVESPRGRLYHRVALTRDGRVLAYDLLAPTEWNLHPAGPLAACLLGGGLGTGETARLRIARLVALFDPCVAFRVECKEAAHA